MPLCGFDEQMLEGLNTFNEGLVENVADKTFVEKVEGEK